MDTINVVIYKPLYGTFVYIRDKYIEKAQREYKYLKIIIPGKAELVCTPNEWLKDCKVMEKEFKIKGQPMRLYGNYVKKKEVIDQKKLF